MWDVKAWYGGWALCHDGKPMVVSQCQQKVQRLADNLNSIRRCAYVTLALWLQAAMQAEAEDVTT